MYGAGAAQEAASAAEAFTVFGLPVVASTMVTTAAVTTAVAPPANTAFRFANEGSRRAQPVRSAGWTGMGKSGDSASMLVGKGAPQFEQKRRV